MFTFMIKLVVLALVSSLVSGRAIPIRRSTGSIQFKRDTVTDFTGGTGDGTYYATGLGACGITNTDADYIAAIGEDFFDQYATHIGDTSGNPNENPICNKKVIATYQGKSVTVAITDRCGGCTNPYSLDFSPTAFSQLADPSVGRITGMTWVWADADSSSSSDSPSSSDSGSPSSSDSGSSPTTAWTTATPTATPTATTSSMEFSGSSDAWTSTSPTATATDTSTDSPLTAEVVANIAAGVNSAPTSSSSFTSSGFTTITSASVSSVTGTAAPADGPANTASSKHTSGARRSVRRIWEL